MTYFILRIISLFNESFLLKVCVFQIKPHIYKENDTELTKTTVNVRKRQAVMTSEYTNRQTKFNHNCTLRQHFSLSTTNHMFRPSML